jgi:hypothetical protein
MKLWGFVGIQISINHINQTIENKLVLAKDGRYW